MAFLPRKRRHRLRCRNENRADGGFGDTERCGNYGDAWTRRKMLWLLQSVRGRTAVYVTAAVCGVFEHNQFGVQIVGEGDDEEEQDQGAGHSGPFAPGSVAAGARLIRPARAPENHAAEGEKKPQYV